MSVILLNPLAEELAESMGESWARLEYAEREWWRKLASVVSELDREWLGLDEEDDYDG